MQVRRFIIGLAVLAAAFVSHPTARACDCGGQDPATAFAAAALVFEGEVISVAQSRYVGRPCSGFCPDIAVRFRVARHWKGRLGREVVVFTGPSNCAYEFRPGMSYLVYASSTGANGPHYTDSCTRTTTMVEAAEDLRALGRGARVR